MTGDVDLTEGYEGLTSLPENLKINGNPDQDFEGIMAAHEQVDVSGNPILNGCIIAESAANNSGQVSENKISGNMHFRYGIAAQNTISKN